MDRRSVLIGGLGAATLGLPARLFAQEDKLISSEGMVQFEPLPEGFNGGLFLRRDPDINFGSNPPPAIYAALAGAILRGSPYNCRPIDIAYYFANLRERKVTPGVLEAATKIASEVGQPAYADPGFLSIFSYDWERSNYYNPVVIGFFKGVGLEPYAGDQTPWCAAFANWSISRSRVRNASEIVFTDTVRRTGTRNASSGSFRCWAQDTTPAPKEGDVIVWAKSGTISGNCPNIGQGHVAFVSSVESGPGGAVRYRVVGGNQGFRGTPAASTPPGTVRPQDVAQAVSYRTIGLSFGDRVLHSIRTEAFLR